MRRRGSERISRLPRGNGSLPDSGNGIRHPPGRFAAARPCGRPPEICSGKESPAARTASFRPTPPRRHRSSNVLRPPETTLSAMDTTTSRDFDAAESTVVSRSTARRPAIRTPLGDEEPLPGDSRARPRHQQPGQASRRPERRPAPLPAAPRHHRRPRLRAGERVGRPGLSPRPPPTARRRPRHRPPPSKARRTPRRTTGVPRARDARDSGLPTGPPPGGTGTRRAHPPNNRGARSLARSRKPLRERGFSPRTRFSHRPSGGFCGNEILRTTNTTDQLVVHLLYEIG